MFILFMLKVMLSNMATDRMHSGGIDSLTVQVLFSMHSDFRCLLYLCKNYAQQAGQCVQGQ